MDAGGRNDSSGTDYIVGVIVIIGAGIVRLWWRKLMVMMMKIVGMDLILIQPIRGWNTLATVQLHNGLFFFQSNTISRKSEFFPSPLLFFLLKYPYFLRFSFAFSCVFSGKFYENKEKRKRGEGGERGRETDSFRRTKQLPSLSSFSLFSLFVEKKFPFLRWAFFYLFSFLNFLSFLRFPIGSKQSGRETRLAPQTHHTPPS